jgi:preprotein translocase subunit SecE
LFIFKIRVNSLNSLSPVLIYMSKVGNYIQEAYDELLHKVSWPTWDELQQTTIIVLVALMIVTLVIFGMDFVADRVLTLIYNILGK